MTSRRSLRRRRPPAALRSPTAIVVKLTRVMLLAPLIAGIALRHRQTGVQRGDRPPLVPPFIVAFVAMVVIASIGIVPDRVLVRIDDLRTVLLGMALFALGTRVNVRSHAAARGSPARARAGLVGCSSPSSRTPGVRLAWA